MVSIESLLVSEEKQRRSGWGRERGEGVCEELGRGEGEETLGCKNKTCKQANKQAKILLLGGFQRILKNS